MHFIVYLLVLAAARTGHSSPSYHIMRWYPPLIEGETWWPRIDVYCFAVERLYSVKYLLAYVSLKIRFKMWILLAISIFLSFSSCLFRLYSEIHLNMRAVQVNLKMNIEWSFSLFMVCLYSPVDMGSILANRVLRWECF